LLPLLGGGGGFNVVACIFVPSLPISFYRCDDCIRCAHESFLELSPTCFPSTFRRPLFNPAMSNYIAALRLSEYLQASVFPAGCAGVKAEEKAQVEEAQEGEEREERERQEAARGAPAQGLR
jgi:hypothetical protein